MNNCKKVVIIYSVFIIASCSNKETNNIIVDKFPEKVILSSKPVKQIKMFSKGNVNLSVLDSFLIIQKAEEKYVQIYSTNTHKLLAETGSSGRGPGEFITPELTNQYNYADKNPCIYVHDLSRNRITYIDIINNIDKPGIINKQEILPNVGNHLTRFFYKGDSSFLAAPEDGGRLLFYDEKKSRKIIKPFVPKLDFSIKKDYLPTIYRSVCCVDEDRGLIALSPILMGRIDFFDLKGEYINSTVFNSTEDLQKELSNPIENNPMLQICDLDSKEGMIYGLNYNNRIQELYPTKTNIKNLKIQVFDWLGHPIKEYILDKHFISSFAVDVINNRIYGYCPNANDHTIVVYDIK